MSRPFLTWRPFVEARAFAQSLGLKNKKQWEQWTKSGERPHDIPVAPNRIYKPEFQDFGDWLGTGTPGKRMPSRSQVYLSLDEARPFVHALGFACFEQYREWAKTDARPDNIPADPRSYYRDRGWRDVGDWLGNGSRGHVRDPNGDTFRSFESAREYARALKLRKQEEWQPATRSPDWPRDIPINPNDRYRDQGWAGWGDFLGNYRTWNKSTIRAFLESLQPLLPELQPAELYTILQASGIIRLDSRNPNWNLIRDLEQLCSRNRTVSLARLTDLLGLNDPQDSASTDSDRSECLSPSPPSTTDDRRAVSKFKSVHAIDSLVQTGLSRQEEVLDFLINNRVADLWQRLFEEGEQATIEELGGEQGGDYFNRVREKFLAQYKSAKELPVPAGYAFAVDGKPTPPNLMQRLTAYRLLTEFRIGNHSGVGAGKSGAAILGSRVVNSHFTVIIAFNSNVEGWSKAILSFFPDSVVLTKERQITDLDPTRHTYLVINYESFQQHWSVEFVRQLTQQHSIGLIVLDEIQSVRQRRESNLSKRRSNVTQFVNSALAANPELRVLGMSATPVINELHEGKALLETIVGQSFAQLDLSPTIRNAIAMHTQFRLHGLRFRPKYSQTITFDFPKIDGNSILPRLRIAHRRSVLQLEQIVLEAKLPEISTHLRPGTLIYTHFVGGIVERLDACIRQAGLRPGQFTGDEKSGLNAFLEHRIDVLIGSGPIGTGIDGLQRVCNRLIFAGLPWTGAEYEQIIGRLHRQGSVFDKVEVIIPQVCLTRGALKWSWDEHRMGIIEYKKTMADAVVDGVIPEGKLPTRRELHLESLHALKKWIKDTSVDAPIGAPSPDQVLVSTN